MRSKNPPPMKLAMSMTVIGLTGLAFCVPAVYALSASEPLGTSITSVLVTAAGVAGLWLGVSKGVQFLGDAMFGRRTPRSEPGSV